MKKLVIISLIFLSVQLFSQTQSLAYRIPFSGNSQVQFDSLSSEKRSKQSLSQTRILSQALIGSAIGIGTAYIGGIIASRFISDKHGYSFFSTGTIYGTLLGYTLGNAIGIYWIGNTDELHGSFGFTLLGSCIGMAAGFYLTTGLTESIAPLLILPGVVGIIAFYLSSEDVVPESSEAFIQIQNEKIQFGAPRIFLTRIDETSNKLRYNFELLRVNF
ncbi:MAG: hypothetical protein M0P61_10730 [Ignavibacteriaceae bacterium]|jgi:hypothetical protein|nr:hypothetical protein [Ignavibacteriaceae bacterium]